jgi:hypothetical protein
MNDLPEEMEPFAETIRDADVTTIAGLRAKTLIAVWDTYPLARNTMVTSVATMSRVIGLCLAALLGDVPIGVELRQADAAGLNVTRPS